MILEKTKAQYTEASNSLSAFLHMNEVENEEEVEDQLLVDGKENTFWLLHGGSTVVKRFVLLTRNQRVVGSNPTWCVIIMPLDKTFCPQLSPSTQV